MASLTGRGARSWSIAPDRCTSAGSTLANAGALSFNSVTMRSATFGPTPGVRATATLSRSAIAWRQRREHGKRHLGADALHGLQQPKPFALGVAAKAE